MCLEGVYQIFAQNQSNSFQAVSDFCVCHRCGLGSWGAYWCSFLMTQFIAQTWVQAIGVFMIRLLRCAFLLPLSWKALALTHSVAGLSVRWYNGQGGMFFHCSSVCAWWKNRDLFRASHIISHWKSFFPVWIFCCLAIALAFSLCLLLLISYRLRLQVAYRRISNGSIFPHLPLL